MEKLIDSDADSLNIYQNLLARGELGARETEEIHPNSVITKEGALKLGCNLFVYLTLITEDGRLIFFENNAHYLITQDNKLMFFKTTPDKEVVKREMSPMLLCARGYTDGSTHKNGKEVEPSMPLLMVRKFINEIRGNDWYGDDDRGAVIILENYYNEKREICFLKKINDSQLEILKNRLKAKGSRIEIVEIKKIPEEQIDEVVYRINLLKDLFKATKPI